MSDAIRRLEQRLGGDSGPGCVAYRHRPAKANRATRPDNPGLIFCGGFFSNMEGSKARFLDSQCAEAGIAYTRFDYRGHGHSDGAFVDGTIGDWYADAQLVFDRVTYGPQIIVGSSMGAWMALMLARDFSSRIAALVLIAPAPDFPRRLMVPSLSNHAQDVLAATGIWHRPSEFEDAAYPITQRLIQESADHELLDGPKIRVPGPVRILHGTADAVVPLSHAKQVLDIVNSQDVMLTEIKDGDHRLSTPENLAILWSCVEAVISQSATGGPP